MPNELSHTFDGRWGREIRAARTRERESIVTNEKEIPERIWMRAEVLASAELREHFIKLNNDDIEYTRTRVDGAAPVVDNWFSEDVCMFCGGKTAHKPDCSHGRDRAPLAATQGEAELFRALSGVVYSHCKGVQLPRGIHGLIDDLAAWVRTSFPSAVPIAESSEAHRCPHCGRRMMSEFDEDVGFWRECANCDYREAVLSAEPSQSKGEGG